MSRMVRVYRTATALALAAACSDGPTGTTTGKQPDPGAPGIHIMAGNNITDTVGARPVQALTVTIRQPDGTRAAGTIVRFQSLTAAPPQQYGYPVYVAPLASNDFRTFAADTTDSTGAAGVVIGFSTIAASGLVQISVPTLGFADTARYTIKVGNVARITTTPADTQLSIGGTMQLRVSTQDTWGNLRNDSIGYSALGSAVNVSATGLVTATATGVGRVVTRAGNVADTISVGVTPQGTVAAYRAGINPEGIVRVSVAGSGETFLAPAGVTAWPPSPSWDPAGTHIVFASSDRLYTVAATGGSTTQFINPPVTNMTQELMPQIARSAGTVFFTAGFSGANLSIWRTDADGSNPTQVLADVLHVYQQPAPSPDGSRLAVVEDNAAIRVLDVGSHTLSSWSLRGTSPQWSPVGDHIVYTSNGTVRMVNADGTADQLISPPGHSYNPWTFGWSPDAHWVIARADAGLELIDPSTGGAITIHNTSSYFYPAWKP